MCYPFCRMMHIKEPLLLIGKNSPCGCSGYPLSLYDWFFTICLKPYNRTNVLSASLNKTFPSLFFNLLSYCSTGAVTNSILFICLVICLFIYLFIYFIIYLTMHRHLLLKYMIHYSTAIDGYYYKCSDSNDVYNFSSILFPYLFSFHKLRILTSQSIILYYYIEAVLTNGWAPRASRYFGALPAL